ncbi:DNA repair protein [Plasmodium gonderi]|uniref:DNA repair protein n=1 Tax=Plasmodium gonderi TaxID=77519 RepID=A0A1Y1J8V1_PLAGO|nr:DNA repair protein [Plasmodium gonderi]GAW78941.1 DNA repair protein [Plasmodium gonderi]
MMQSDESENEREKENYNNILYDGNLKDEIDYYDENLPHINFYLKFQKKNFLEKFLQEVMISNKKDSDVEKEVESGKNFHICNDEVRSCVNPIEVEVPKKENTTTLRDMHNHENEVTQLYTEEGFGGLCKSNQMRDACKSNQMRDACKSNQLRDADTLEILNDGGFYLEENSEMDYTQSSISHCKEQGSDFSIPHLVEPRGEQILQDSELSESLLKLKMSCIESDANGDLIHLNENDEIVKRINKVFQKNKDKFIFSIERNIENSAEIILQEYCFLCNKKKKLNKILSVINIYICYDCKILDSNFRMISLTKLVNKYSLNTYDMSKYEKHLALLCTKNPRGYSKQMKLYFLFQIKEVAIRKHGSMEKVKSLYMSKILNSLKNAHGTTASASRKRKNLHKFAKPKSIYSQKMNTSQVQKIICDDNQHEFDSPQCTSQEDGLYLKVCKKCTYQVEYMQF